MSTTLGVINGEIGVCRFWGGEDRGVCVQLTGDNGYVQMTVSEIIAALPMLKEVIDAEMGRRLKECEKAIEETEALKNSIVSDMKKSAEMAINLKILNMSAMLNTGTATVTDREVGDGE